MNILGTVLGVLAIITLMSLTNEEMCGFTDEEDKDG
jgi:hypothetical protein